jgi:hypothetical protein
MFWDMHDTLFENQRRLSLATIFMIGAGLGLPQPAMRTALETGQYKNKVRNDFMGGVRSASTAHPPFLSTVGDMTALMTTPPWCRQSRCASPPTRMTNQASTRPDQRDVSKNALRIDNGQCCFGIRDYHQSGPQTSGENHGRLHRIPNTSQTH